MLLEQRRVACRMRQIEEMVEEEGGENEHDENDNK
jgi:hypothetical protein